MTNVLSLAVNNYKGHCKRGRGKGFSSVRLIKIKVALEIV